MKTVVRSFLGRRRISMFYAGPSSFSSRTMRTMRTMLGQWLAFLAAASSVLAVPAWSQSCTSYVVVAVYDRKSGDDIKDLNAGDFEAMVGKASAKVVSATPQFTDRLVVLVETDDTSNDRIDQVVNLATRMARQAPDGKPMAFGVFVKRSAFTQGFIANPKERATAISGVAEEEPTLGREVYLYNALHQALQLFGPHQPGDTVLVITDGYDEGSQHSGVQVEKEFVNSGTRLFVSLRRTPSHVSGDYPWRSPERLIHFVEKMSGITGGIFGMFGAREFSFPWQGYMLGIEVPVDAAKHHKLKVRLQGAAALKYHKVNLYYPERVPACSSPTTDAPTREETAHQR